MVLAAPAGILLFGRCAVPALRAQTGRPAALAAEYGGDDPPADESVANTDRADASTRMRRRRTLSYTLLAATMVACAAAVLLRGNATSAGAAPYITVGSVAGGTTFPFEDVHWAERLVFFAGGTPGSQQSTRPDAALGAPDCVNTETQPERVICLGRRGELVVEFLDRCAIDGPGADLVVIELGYSEPVFVDVSEDGESWLETGATRGHWGTIDLAAIDAGDRKFRFVRLRDAGSNKSRDTVCPGADVDAIGAIHTVSAQ